MVFHVIDPIPEETLTFHRELLAIGENYTQIVP